MAGVVRRIFANLPRINTCNYVKTPLLSILPSVTSKFYSNVPTPYEIVDAQEDRKTYQGVIDNVNRQVAEKKQGRLFAVVHVAGKQVKITEGDVFIVEGYWPPDAGDKISLDKVLLVGASDFTLIGRPLVQRGLVRVEATVIEKNVSHTKTHFRKKRRKQYMRINFYRTPRTMVRVNRIEIVGEVNHPPAVTGLETRIF
ncbi:large ribosomal subunit protein bL21m [Tribolium castaneum]|uniref:Large ribosomal subunit protein bL21m n=1 Tax=Tribolium castaneum TaxID=7070 RepID=D2A293_TRICA|nr:PREDICTED: 39S ribosomal protein L21, mitochondrial [Tribolium castaneum]EFA02054.1 39S ribosomal protein L21, mitochondrial-like Protein [Tribolium castaneum]|eukprot:XP_974435.1 PREDICTED: 39S ribosomal protein L21, mitochondrial [Tribolium castaneum]